MRNEDLNPCVLALDNSHPAKQFLLAFIECRDDCVGLELGPDEPIDQEWKSVTDDKVWTFSGFAYSFLSLDIALDDFHQSMPRPNESNANWLWDLTRLKCLMNECAQASRQSGNNEILEATEKVLKMFNLWEDYLKFRKDMISQAHDGSRPAN
jgi:hypothetical protein